MYFGRCALQPNVRQRAKTQVKTSVGKPAAARIAAPQCRRRSGGGWLVRHAYTTTRVKVALVLTWVLFQFGFFVSPPPVLAAEVLWLPWLAAYPPRETESSYASSRRG